MLHGGSVLFAHAGGWDEMLLVLLPVAVFAGLLWLANRRAVRQQTMPDGHDADKPAGGPPPATGAVPGPTAEP